MILCGADALVPILDANREGDRILHAVPAPGGADATLHRAHGLAIGVTALETGVDQLFPDFGQFLDQCAEHVDPLSAGDFRVQPVLLGHAGDDGQFLGRDLAARNSRHDGIGPAALQIGKEPVVGVLQRMMFGLEDIFGPQAGQDRGHRRLANFAAEPTSAMRERRRERAQLLGLDDGE